MSGAVDTRVDARIVRLEPELTIYSAARVKQTLVDALVARDALTLDLADVCEVDSAGVQLLLAAMRQACAQGVPLHLAGHSAAVQEAFALVGLDAQLAPHFINAN
ncbi:MAG TPA: STAS domain-containing protein [Telluria sp.]|jgi:anti-anti-sigma factor